MSLFPPRSEDLQEINRWRYFVSQQLAASQNVIFTETGAIAVRMKNKSGARTVKGELVVASADDDTAFTVAGAGALMPIGAVYQGGVQDGEWAYVAVTGIVEVLLEDNTSATRGYYVMTADTAGRAYAAFSSPPINFYPTTESLTGFTSGSGAVANLQINDGTRRVLNEPSAGSNHSVEYTFSSVVVSPESLVFSGHYTGNHAVTIDVYDYSASAWRTVDSLTTSATQDEDYIYSLASNWWDSTNKQYKIRFMHTSSGVNTHRLNLDYIQLRAPVSYHNREIGHCVQTVPAGTNNLAKIVMHFN